MTWQTKCLEKLSSSLAFYKGNSSVTSGFPSQRVSNAVFFVIDICRMLHKQSSGLWFNLTTIMLIRRQSDHSTLLWLIQRTKCNKEQPDVNSKSSCKLSLVQDVPMESWWRHQRETFFPYLALCEGNSSVTGEFPSQRLVMQSFDVFLNLCLNKRLSKPWRRRWFETPSHSLWHHCNDNGGTLQQVMSIVKRNNSPRTQISRKSDQAPSKPYRKEIVCKRCILYEYHIHFWWQRLTKPALRLGLGGWDVINYPSRNCKGGLVTPTKLTMWVNRQEELRCGEYLWFW